MRESGSFYCATRLSGTPSGHAGVGLYASVLLAGLFESLRLLSHIKTWGEGVSGHQASCGNRLAPRFYSVNPPFRATDCPRCCPSCCCRAAENPRAPSTKVRRFRVMLGVIRGNSSLRGRLLVLLTSSSEEGNLASVCVCARMRACVCVREKEGGRVDGLENELALDVPA